MRGEHRLAKRFENIGFYGEIVVEVEPTDDPFKLIIIDPRIVVPSWRSGIEFGILHALDHITKRTQPNYQVTVVELKTHPVDTTASVLAFISAMAVIDAFKVEVQRTPYIATASGTIVFPK